MIVFYANNNKQISIKEKFDLLNGGEIVTNKDIHIINEEILHYLCDEFDKNPCPLFTRKEEYQCFSELDLNMVMDKVVSGLKSAQRKLDK